MLCPLSYRHKMVWVAGLEPAASGLEGRRSACLSYTHAFRMLRSVEVEPPARIELATSQVQTECSSNLNLGGIWKGVTEEGLNEEVTEEGLEPSTTDL